jgi:hypothetical protein
LERIVQAIVSNNLPSDLCQPQPRDVFPAWDYWLNLSMSEKRKLNTSVHNLAVASGPN